MSRDGGQGTKSSTLKLTPWMALIAIVKGASRFFGDESSLALAAAIETSDRDPDRIEKAAYLIEDLNLRGRQGITPLIYAAMRSKLNAYRTLIEAGADIGTKADNGEGVMSIAAIHPNIEYLRLALQHEGDPNTIDASGMPILGRSVENHLVENVRLLLEFGANVDSSDRSGTPSLGIAILMGWTDLIEVLIGGNARVDIENKFGVTPEIMISDEWRSPAVKDAFRKAIQRQ